MKLERITQTKRTHKEDDIFFDFIGSSRGHLALKIADDKKTQVLILSPKQAELLAAFIKNRFLKGRKLVE